MIDQPRPWTILSDEEDALVWARVNAQLHFNRRSMVNGLPPFQMPVPFDLYDLRRSQLVAEDDAANRWVRTAFAECLGGDDFMYALDLDHTSFRYNPRIEDQMEYPVFVADARHQPWGGYNVYFPKFYPDGDFFFFLADDLRWGYLTYPWLDQAWVFGERLRELFREQAENLGIVTLAAEESHGEHRRTS